MSFDCLNYLQLWDKKTPPQNEKQNADVSIGIRACRTSHWQALLCASILILFSGIPDLGWGWSHS